MNKVIPPYFAVIFIYKLKRTRKSMIKWPKKCILQPNFKKVFSGFKSVRQQLGITISYWESLNHIKNWKNNFEHQEAQTKGMNLWHEAYEGEICIVDRKYTFNQIQICYLNKHII